MFDGTLEIRLKDGASYTWEACTKIRQGKDELRWTNARGEKRAMHHKLIFSWWVE